MWHTTNQLNSISINKINVTWIIEKKSYFDTFYRLSPTESLDDRLNYGQSHRFSDFVLSYCSTNSRKRMKSYKLVCKRQPMQHLSKK